MLPCAFVIRGLGSRKMLQVVPWPYVDEFLLYRCTIPHCKGIMYILK